jgi:mRNA-degrading endonuclease RelE of RelBE toxin-antitoxin system
MKYEIKVVPSFVKELKKLSKKYKSIKKDYANLLEILSQNPKENSISIGKNCYKIRLKNSDNKKGKSGGYRVIYIVIDEEGYITLLSIYSKSDVENISENLIDSKIIESIS